MKLREFRVPLLTTTAHAADGRASSPTARAPARSRWASRSAEVRFGFSNKMRSPIPAIQEERSPSSKTQPLPETPHRAKENFVTMKSILAVLGAILGAAVGFVLRPANMLTGQLDFETTLLRGTNLTGVNRLLVFQAEASFNFLIWAPCSAQYLACSWARAHRVPA